MKQKLLVLLLPGICMILALSLGLYSDDYVVLVEDVGLPLGAYLCFHLGWGAPGLWTGLSVALILIGSALLYFWRRKEKSFATMTFSVPKDLAAANPSAS